MIFNIDPNWSLCDKITYVAGWTIGFCIGFVQGIYKGIVKILCKF